MRVADIDWEKTYNVVSKMSTSNILEYLTNVFEQMTTDNELEYDFVTTVFNLLLDARGDVDSMNAKIYDLESEIEDLRDML